MSEEFIRCGIPYTTRPHLKSMSDEVGVDMDKLLASIKANQSDLEMSIELGVTEKTVSHLRGHFERFGLGNSQGED